MDPSIHLEMLTVGMIGTRCYILSRDGFDGCIVIDPGDEAQRIRNACKGKRIVAILLTHGHFDHIGAINGLAAEDTQILIHEADGPLLTDSFLNASAPMAGFVVTTKPATRLLKDGDVLELCGMTLKVIHTPGHTQGCVCYELEDRLFTGDTLFEHGYGRTDLAGGDQGKLLQSLRKLMPYLDDHMIYPGH